MRQLRAVGPILQTWIGLVALTSVVLVGMVALAPVASAHDQGSCAASMRHNAASHCRLGSRCATSKLVHHRDQRSSSSTGTRTPAFRGRGLSRLWRRSCPERTSSSPTCRGHGDSSMPPGVACAAAPESCFQWSQFAADIIAFHGRSAHREGGGRGALHGYARCPGAGPVLPAAGEPPCIDKHGGHGPGAGGDGSAQRSRGRGMAK